MRHQTWITPLTCHFGAEFASFVEWTKEAFERRETPAIYCKDPDASWFRMKTAAEYPYLEPAIFGVRGGDLVTVHCEALVRRGKASLAVDVLRIGPDYEVSLLVSNELPQGAVDTYFKQFSIPYLLHLKPEDLGIVLRIHPTGTDNEVIVRSLWVEVISSNHALSLEPNVVTYDRVGDYLTCIRTYSLTGLDPAYRSVHDLFAAGHVRFPDDGTVAFTGHGTPGFRGLMALHGATRYRTPVAVYCEYRAAHGADVLAVHVDRFDAFGTKLAGEARALPAAAEWTPAACYFAGDGRADAYHVLMSVGTSAAAAGLELRRIRFAMPRFDDAPKRPANRLEDWFPELGSLLKARG